MIRTERTSRVERERDVNKFQRRKSKPTGKIMSETEKPPETPETPETPEPIECSASKLEEKVAILEQQLAEAKLEVAKKEDPKSEAIAEPTVEVVATAEAVAEADAVAEPKVEIEEPAKETASIGAAVEDVAVEEVVEAAEADVPAAENVGENIGENFKAEVESDVAVEAVGAVEEAQEIGAPVEQAVGEVVEVEAEAEVAVPTSGPADETKAEAEETAEAEGEDGAEGDEEKMPEDEKIEPLEDKDDQLMALIVRVTKLEEKISGSAGPLALAEAALAAANSVAVAAAQQNARVEVAATETARSLGAKMEETFQQIATSTVETHAELIGTRLNSQLEERLNLARETVASLGVLKGEMKSIGKSLQADVSSEPKTTISGLERHSILDSFK